MTVVRETVAALARDTVEQGIPARKMYSFSGPYGRSFIQTPPSRRQSPCRSASPRRRMLRSRRRARASRWMRSTVTGSRIRRSTDFDTRQSDDGGRQRLPEEHGHRERLARRSRCCRRTSRRSRPPTPATANFFAGSTIANLRGLNPFFGSRTAQPRERPALRADQPGRRRRSQLPAVRAGRARRRRDRRRFGGVRLRAPSRASTT